MSQSDPSGRSLKRVGVAALVVYAVLMTLIVGRREADKVATEPTAQPAQSPGALISAPPVLTVAPSPPPAFSATPVESAPVAEPVPLRPAPAPKPAVKSRVAGAVAAASAAMPTTPATTLVAPKPEAVVGTNGAPIVE
jgi:hypothetical protein